MRRNAIVRCSYDDSKVSTGYRNNHGPPDAYLCVVLSVLVRGPYRNRTSTVSSRALILANFERLQDEEREDRRAKILRVKTWQFLFQLFNQITLVCDWWYNVDCKHAKEFYDYSNKRLYTGSDSVFLDDENDYVFGATGAVQSSAQPAKGGKKAKKGGKKAKKPEEWWRNQIKPDQTSFCILDCNFGYRGVVFERPYFVCTCKDAYLNKVRKGWSRYCSGVGYGGKWGNCFPPASEIFSMPSACFWGTPKKCLPPWHFFYGHKICNLPLALFISPFFPHCAKKPGAKLNVYWFFFSFDRESPF